MLNKLSLRNAKRSTKDYFIYIVTMTIISTLMFALHGMLFSKNIQSLYLELGLFGALIGIASFFVVLIIIWLIRYMVTFMLEKRSREFGTYLLLGMKKKDIYKMFRRENLLLCSLTTLLGILPGIFFQMAFSNIFYSILKTGYKLTPELSIWNILMTSGLLLLADLLALRNVKKKFRKLNIHSLMYEDKKNEQQASEKRTWKKCFVFLSVGYIIFFNIMTLTSAMTIRSVWIYIILLIAAIYLLYIGLSSFFVSYMNKRHSSLYKEANVFILRQLSSKIKTMRFTMGTLSILFTAALLGWTIVMMFSGYQMTQSEIDYPFDIIIFSDQSDDDFQKQLDVIEDNDVTVEDLYIYHTYRNDSAQMNDYLYEHIDGTWREDPDDVAEGKRGTATYYEYDTYLRLSDYNYIRSMLGYESVSLKDDSYLLHAKERIHAQVLDAAESLTVQTGTETLSFAGLYEESLSQNGMNGADYIIVIPDSAADEMDAYYSLMAISTSGKIPADLQEQLDESQNFTNPITYEDQHDILYGAGSNAILSSSATAMVSENLLIELNSVVTIMCYMLAYLGIVFLCAALTIMTIQQLSDSNKYKFRYAILKNLGLNKKETDIVVLKQLGIYYFCPFIISIVLSMFIGMFASERFVYYTGVHAGIFQYYLLAVLVFAIIYLIYFAVTFIGFTRNINK